MRHGKPRFRLLPIDPDSAQARRYEQMTAQGSVVTSVRYADLFPEDPERPQLAEASRDSR
jgi:antitoxin (DNA-binding transcriptional repressor) of toxin-antitoxin stability system